MTCSSWCKERLECYKQTYHAILVGIQNGNVDTEGQAHKVTQGNKDSIGNWDRGHLCYILANNLAMPLILE